MTPIKVIFGVSVFTLVCQNVCTLVLNARLCQHENILKTNPNIPRGWFPLSFNILCSFFFFFNRWCNTNQNLIWFGYFWCIKSLSLLLFPPLISSIHQHCTSLSVSVCLQMHYWPCEWWDASSCVYFVCMSVCLLKPTTVSHACGSVTWIFCFGSGFCGFPWYGRHVEGGAGGGGCWCRVLSNRLPRDLMPLSWDTWAPYIAGLLAFVKMRTSSNIPFQTNLLKTQIHT